MSSKVMESLIAQDLPCAEKMVAMVLAYHYNNKTGRCYPGKATIARESGLCVRAVDRVLTRLKARGFIEYVSTNGRHSNSYTLQFVQGSTQHQVQGSNNSNPVPESFNPVPESANPVPRTGEPIKKLQRTLKEDADASPREIIFSVGLSILTRAGTKESSARTFLGKYAKQDETKLAEVIGYLAANPKVEPKSYIAAAFKPQQRRAVI